MSAAKIDPGVKVMVETLEKLVEADEAKAVPAAPIESKPREMDLVAAIRKAKKEHTRRVEFTAKCRLECGNALIDEAKAKKELDDLRKQLTQAMEG